MKTNSITVKLLRRLLCVGIVAVFVGCNVDPLQISTGNLPDKETLENTYGTLRSKNSADKQIQLMITEGTGSAIDKFYYQITKPALEALSFTAQVDESLLDAYNKDNETTLKLLPVANYEFPDGATVTIATGKYSSEPVRITINADGLAAGSYLIPITVANPTSLKQNESNTLYYIISVRALQKGDVVLNTDDVFIVFYVNTSVYQPLLVEELFVDKNKIEGRKQIFLWRRTIGNIINLRIAMLDYETATSRAKLLLTSDMSYVLDNAIKYIRPLQDKGRKVCLSLEGGGKGLGFCNMTDYQIADFTSQVKTIVETYALDGINLWDKNSGYGTNGMPAMNTTSYPKLIVALKEALGANKILTVTDYEKPTEYFWDTKATGGIQVGKFIDYVWSGYNSESETIQILDPWNLDNENVSKHTHKPISGLAPSKYGSINVPFYPTNGSEVDDDGLDRILEWKNAKMKPSQILVFADLLTLVQGNYEGTLGSLSYYYDSFADDGVITTGRYGSLNSYYLDTEPLNTLPSGANGYGKWLKDWQ